MEIVPESIIFVLLFLKTGKEYKQNIHRESNINDMVNLVIKEMLIKMNYIFPLVKLVLLSYLMLLTVVRNVFSHITTGFVK
jgi:hypothetical protein